MEINTLEIGISKLELKEGDHLVIRIGERLSEAEIARLKMDIKTFLPEYVKCILINSTDIELSTINFPDEDK